MLRLFAFLLTLTLASWTVSNAQAQTSIYSTNDGAAIGGYDTVAYFVMGRAIPGQPGISVMWKGAVWHFASEAHREAFEANPRAYAPQYGGYCAYGLSAGHLSHGDPLAWDIRNGRLYLAHSEGVLRLWQSDINRYMRDSEINWPSVLYE